MINGLKINKSNNNNFIVVVVSGEKKKRKERKRDRGFLLQLGDNHTSKSKEVNALKIGLSSHVSHRMRNFSSNSSLLSNF